MRDLGLVYLPASGGFLGAEKRHLEQLRHGFPHLDWRWCRSEEETLELLPQATAALLWSFPAHWSEIAGKLRFLSTPAAGKERILVKERPDLLLSYGAFHGELMGETVVGMMLTFVRGIKHCIDRQRRGWARGDIGSGMRTLRGSHVVIVGFGSIGKWVAKLLKPFAVRITGVNRKDMTHPEYFSGSDTVIPVTELDSVLPQADHLILILPGTGGTDGMIDARRLSLLRREAYVYNVGRGNSLDLEALAQALQQGRIQGAALDVFPEEPLPENAAIRSCAQAIIMPHISAYAPNYLDLYIDELFVKLRDVFSDSSTKE